MASDSGGDCACRRGGHTSDHGVAGMSDQKMKACTKCGSVKPFTEQYFAPNGGGYLRPSCRECAKKAVSKWQKDHPDRVKDRQLRYYYSNIDSILQRGRQYRA